MKTASFVLLATLTVAAPPAVAAGQAPLIQNARVTVWDVPAGAPAPAVSPSHDVVTFVMRGDAAKADASAFYRAKGAPALPVAAGARTIVIELQDPRVPPLPNTSGYPLAFPRPGSTKLLDNDRVVVWSFTWTPGVATPMHFHDKDVVVTYLAEGALTSTDAQGKTVVNEHHFGYTKFNPRDRVHTERLARGQGSAVMVELK